MNQLVLCFYGLCLIAFPAVCQVRVRGQVVSGRTGEAIPFASVGVQNTSLGTVADSSGQFSLLIGNPSQTLIVQSMGYATRLVSVNQSARIELNDSHLQLNEVRIRAINAAHRIIRQTVANLPQNDSDQLASYQYEAYHVTTMSRLDGSRKPSSGQALYVNESYSSRQFLAPNLSREEIIGSRTSGTQTTLLASLRPLLQPFGFHKPQILVKPPLMKEQVSYLNPLSLNSETVYDFFWSDTLVHTPGDTTFVIDYEPRRGRGFVGLKGVLRIRSGSFAPEYVLAEPADPATMLRFRFEQTYQLVQDHWFPAEIRSEWILSPSAMTGVGTLRIESRSLLTNVQLNPPIPPATFDQISVVMRPDAARQSDAFWQTHRLDSLTVPEQQTFVRLAELRGWQRFKTQTLPTLGEWGLAGMVPMGRYLNLSSQTLLDANLYEGTRLTLNVLTSPAFSSVLRLDGKLSYGTRDRIVKYEGRARVLLHSASRMYLTGAYRFDVSEPGNVQFFIWNNPQIPYELLRTFLLSRADSLRQWRLEGSFRMLKHTTVTVSLIDESRRPTYAYRFLAPEYEHMPMIAFRTTEFGLGFRYAYNEQFAQVGQGSIVAQAPSPVWSVQVIRGIMNRLLGGQYDYTKLNTRYEQLIRHRRMGETYLQATAGILWGKLPYPYLYNGRGARSETNVIWVANHFQTMGLYEFTSDRYATLFVTHNFRTLLGKPRVGWFRPEPSVVQGISYGGLRSPEQHEGIPIRTLERGFFESGLLVDNLYRQRVLKAAYVGVGVGAFYRWGPNANPNPTDNWAYRLVWNIGF